MDIKAYLIKKITFLYAKFDDAYNIMQLMYILTINANKHIE